MATIDQIFQKANKKKKSKINCANFLETERQNDETRRKMQEEAKMNETTPQISENIYFNKILQDDKDWKPIDEFEAKEIIDTTNVRMQNLAITETFGMTKNTDEKTEDSVIDIENDDDEEAQTVTKSWATKIAASSKVEIEENNVEAEDLSVPNDLPSQDPNVTYVPPHLQRGLGGAPRPMRTAPAPNLSNTEEFPSLGDLPSLEGAEFMGNQGTDQNEDNNWIEAKSKKANYVTTDPVAKSGVYIPLQRRQTTSAAVVPDKSVVVGNMSDTAGTASNVYVPPHLQKIKTQNRFAI